MQLAVTFRHMDATNSLKEYAKEKVERITKYFPDPIKAHVVLSCDRGYEHHADVVITLHNGIVIKGEEATEDMYSSIDLVMAKIERQVRRYKEKLRGHRPSNERELREVHHSVITETHANGEAQSAQAAAGGQSAAASKPHIVTKEKLFARSLTVDEAVMQLNLLGNDFLVFTNAGSNDVNVVYRRKDGTYGLIETGASGSSAA